MEKKKAIVLSGVRPTGDLHLGNYFGAITNYVKMQEDYDCYFMVADLHSLTTHPDTSGLKDHIKRVIATFLAAGIDPHKATLYCQSQLYTTGELYLYLNMLAYKGELEKTVTFKEKARQQPDNINAGLLTYPVLMAADILIHNARYVPVGKDQEQHIEMARNFVNRFNYRYGEVFNEPEAFNFSQNLVKIPSLDGTGKMSKSINENATLFLSDSDEVIRKKIMKAKTDSGPAEPNSAVPDYIENLFSLMDLVGDKNGVDHFRKSYDNCTIRYGDFKKQLAEDMIHFIAPIRKKIEEIYRDETLLGNVMNHGAEKANEHAGKIMEQVRKAMRLNYFS